MTQKHLYGLAVSGSGVASSTVGATQPANFRGGVASVAPTTGTFAVGDYVIGSTGQIHICITPGTPGVWASHYAINFVTPSSDLGTSSIGTATTAARADHVHAMPSIGQLVNVLLATPASGQVLTFDGTRWINADPSGGTGGSTPLAGSAPPAVGTATTGTSTFAARADHTHAQQAAVAPTGLTGTSQASRYVGGVSGGSPSSGTFVVGDWCIDNVGGIYICTTAGSPGTWAAIGPRSTVVPSPIGTAGPGTDYRVARADHVHAQQAAVTPTGITGATAATRYTGGTVSGAPTTGTFAAGDFVIAQNGVVWVCTTAGTPGTWAAVGSLSSNTPAALGTAAPGTAISAARSDHVHAIPQLNQLSNVAITSIAVGQTITWNGTSWVNSTPTTGGGANSLQRLLYNTGTSSYPTRPSGVPAGLVDYLGPVQPTDWLSGDTWTDNSQ